MVESILHDTNNQHLALHGRMTVPLFVSGIVWLGFFLELLLCGSREVSISQWKDNISYEGGFDSDHPTVQSFWEMIEGYSQTQIAQILQFSTGTSCLPSDGFEGLTPPFTLCLLRNVSTDHLPVAHTCLNRIDIPPYESKDVMKERFGKAIRYASQGFSLH